MTESTITQKQMADMRHALGMDYKKKPYRNRFYTDSNDPDWNDLVSKGLATKRNGWEDGLSFFFLTFEAVKMVYKKPISKKYYDEL